MDTSAKSSPKGNLPATSSPRNTNREEATVAAEVKPAADEDNHATASTQALETETNPAVQEQDANGWSSYLDQNGFTFFYNHRTQQSQYENPYAIAQSIGQGPAASAEEYHKLNYDEPHNTRPPYNPREHGNYNDYLDKYGSENQAPPAITNPTAGMTVEERKAWLFSQQAKFTGPSQRGEASRRTERDYSENARAENQQRHFFDLDAYQASLDGRSQKEERRNKKLSRKQVQEYRVAKKEKKDKKARDWLSKH